MKVLVAVALLFLVVADAHHTPEHTLRGPRFAIGKVQVYDVELNVTAGIPGLSSQVSKSALKGELHVYAKSEREHILKFTKVYTSGSVKAVESKYADVPMQKNRELESKLSVPIKFTLENGEVTSYTLSPRESLESKKIKKAILRSLEMHVPHSALQQMESSKPSLRIPVVYNVTKDFGFDEHTAYYMITVSPDVEFPYSNMVYNISRTENFKGKRSFIHKLHHNFDQQTCESACQMWSNNEHESRCSSEYESTPVKAYVQHNHHLVYDEGVMTPEIIHTVEVHDAKMYDQDMKVLIRQKIRKIGYSRSVIDEPTEQPTYRDLQDQQDEINEINDEINSRCENTNPGEALEAAKRLLKELSMIIIEGDLETRESTIVGEKVILLKRALSKLKVSHLKTLSREITSLSSLKRAQEDEKVKRQLWMDILPLIGTEESVSFIVYYIRENIPSQSLMMWEVKEMLQALPYNIHMPSETILQELFTILSLPQVHENHLFHSAAYSCVARVIHSMCNGTEFESSEFPRSQRSMFQRYENHYSNLQQTRSRFDSRPECPVALVKTIMQNIIHSLETSQKQAEIVVYIDTLSQIGVSEVLPVITEYAHGTADNIQDLSPSYIEFVKSSALYSLHNLVDRFPQNVLEIVMPIYFNETETPKIRTAAFGILIRCHPPLEVLQHVASHSWSERSNEVGSFVTSTMDTFGNSSLPCMELTSYHIKQVMPMMKRFDLGLQHAKNWFWTHFDDIRMFGLKNHLSYVPNNASIFPSSIYHSLTYSTDNLIDTLFEGSLNTQGITQEEIFEEIIRYFFRLSQEETIPKSKERSIFEEARIVERVPKPLRVTLYKRMFYSSSFYYLDRNSWDVLVNTWTEYMDTYLKTSSSDHSGHLLKMFMPSSLHTVMIAKSLPYTVEFQMEHPIVLAVKVESKERKPAFNKFHLHLRPSVYISKLLTHQIKNLGDCKEIGVYHENKLAISFPFDVKFFVEDLLDVAVHYKIPDVPKKVLYYFTESGTYAERKDLEMLPSSKDREPIRTLPSPLKNSTTIQHTAMPPILVESYTEDLSVDKLNSAEDAADFIVKKILNAGWRYKSTNITLEENSRIWPKESGATLLIQHNRFNFAKGMSQQQRSATWSESRNTVRSSEWMSRNQDSMDFDEQNDEGSWDTGARRFWDRNRRDDSQDDKWTEELKPQDILTNGNPSTFINQGKKIWSMFSSIPHINHVLLINLESSPVHSFAKVRVEYNHTHSKSLLSFHLDAATKAADEHTAKQISADHVIGFAGKTDEFHYDRHNDGQTAVFFTAVRKRDLGCSCPWKDVEIVAKGLWEYESLYSILKEELESGVDPKVFLSEYHDQCMEDVRNGHSLSSSCMKAIQERFVYNKLRMSILWNNNLSKDLRNMAYDLDAAIKHQYYKHMTLKYDPNTENKIHVQMHHIDLEEPLFDVVIKKPKETITLKRMPVVSMPMSTLDDMLKLDFMFFTNNTYPPTCIMMEKSIRTYDLKYYPTSLDTCSYVLTAHCTQTKNFAVISKILSTDGMKELHIHIGPHTLIFSPKSGSYYTIKYDNQDYVISEPHVFKENTDEIYIFSEKYASEHRHLELVAHKAGIRVRYDGKNVKVEIDPRYKGQTCGLCSEFDGETVREFRGVDKCLYTHPVDFVNSAVITGACKKQPSHPFICDDTNRVWSPVRNTAKYEPSIKRNVIKRRGNDLCFSIHAVSVCNDDSEPTETESIPLEFHCLPRQDITAKRLVSESKRRTLGELENKSIDYEENVEVAKMC